MTDSGRQRPARFSRRFLGVAVPTIAAFGIATGTAIAAPTTQMPPSSKATALSPVQGTASGIGYSAQPTADGSGLTTTLDAGVFSLSSAGDLVEVRRPGGEIVGSVLLELRTGDRTVALQPEISNGGTAMTLRPVGLPVAAGAVSVTEERWNAEVQRATMGALIGAGIGLIPGLMLGILIIPVFLFPAIGAGIGFLAVGGQPLIEAGIAHFTAPPA
ncbi:hypothetical protein ACFWUP_06370 [Nocardia sp. NPDC058658]|uniref:hypothetical protein n=1 Tax=Nocardia sp. NPDC058658 TaxID=3346580 RepID=UPI0036665A4E